jgi:hypothetical protein
VSVVVFTEEAGMERFMKEVGLEGLPRQIANDREFSHFLQGLRHPVTAIAFDSNPRGREINARWMVEVQELLAKHLPWAASPWSYPVYVLAECDGLSCIDGASESRGSLRVMSLFTKLENAEQYMRDAGIDGSVKPISAPDDLRELLEGLEATVTAIALDPTAVGEQRTAPCCVEIPTVLEKYVPRSS